MSVGALQRATYDDIDLLASYPCEILIEIEIIAGKECKAQALKLENIRRSDLVAVGNVKLVTALGVCLDLARSRVNLEITPDYISLSVDSVSRVSYSPLSSVARIDENH